MKKPDFAPSLTARTADAPQDLLGPHHALPEARSGGRFKRVGASGLGAFFLTALLAGPGVRLEAQDDSLRITPGGAVGFGTSSPTEDGHLLRTDATDTFFKLENTNAASQAVGYDFGNSTETWSFRVSSNGIFALRVVGGVQPLKIVNSTGEVQVLQDLSVFQDLHVTGVCTGCDGVFAEGFGLESIEEHASSMWEKSYLPSVGPTPEGPTRINVFEKTTGILQELEKAHIYIEQLNTRLKASQAENAELRERLLRVERALGLQP